MHTFFLDLCVAIRTNDPVILNGMSAAWTFFGDPDLTKNCFFLDSVLIFLFKGFSGPDEQINEYTGEEKDDEKDV